MTCAPSEDSHKLADIRRQLIEAVGSLAIHRKHSEDSDENARMRECMRRGL